MKDFTITFKQKEDGTLYALLQNEGHQASLISEPLSGDLDNDRTYIRSFFDNLGQLLCERCFPELGGGRIAPPPTWETSKTVP